MAKTTMKQAYDAVSAQEKKSAPAPPKASSGGKSAPQTFVSDKVGDKGEMVTCPECGAHFVTKYRDDDDMC